MPALIAASAVRSCFGDGARTFAALLRPDVGAVAARHVDFGRSEADRAGADHPDAVDPDPAEEITRAFRAGRLLAACVGDAARQAGLDPLRQRVVALVGTGPGDVVEDPAPTGSKGPRRRLRLDDVVRRAVTGVADVITISGAGSAGGHALALAQDLVDLGEVDAVVACGVETLTRAMVALVCRAPTGTARRRPDHDGVLPGEGAAALVVVPESWSGTALGRLVGTGLSCDAYPDTALDIEGISRAMRDAYDRAGRSPADVDLLIASGTGTARNDPAECEALRKVVLGAGGDPVVTEVSGSTGTPGSLVDVDVALRCIAGGVAPPVAGGRLARERTDLRFAVGTPVPLRPELVQVNAFGFGGVNAVALLESP